MTVLIAVFVAITIAIAWQVLAPKIADQRIVFNNAPDRPCSFGPDMAWIAIKTQDSGSVVDALGVGDPVPANWNSGIGTVYDAQLGENRVFVSPPVNGWVFVVGNSLPHPHGALFVDKCTPLLVHLGEQFRDVQYFASYPDLDLFIWAKLASGRVVRAFGIGEQGVIWARGRTTQEERLLGLKLFELRGVRGRKGDAGGELLMHPTQEHVMRLAGHWSINPTLLDGMVANAGLGTICKSPLTWRSERIRKSA